MYPPAAMMRALSSAAAHQYIAFSEKGNFLVLTFVLGFVVIAQGLCLTFDTDNRPRVARVGLSNQRRVKRRIDKIRPVHIQRRFYLPA